MDVQAKVAARRVELEETARRAQAASAEEVRSRQIVEQARREEALTAIAADLSTGEVKVARQGDELVIAAPFVPAIDIDGLRRDKVARLLKREARKLWSPGENWQVIGLIVGGLFLITFYGVGLLVILGGMLRGSTLNKRYRAEVQRRYPGLFPPKQEAVSE